VFSPRFLSLHRQLHDLLDAFSLPRKKIVTLTHTHRDHIIKDIFSTSIINYIKRRNLLFRVLCRKHSFVRRGDAPRTNHSIVALFFSLQYLHTLWNDNEKRHKIIIIIAIIMVYYNYLSSYCAKRKKICRTHRSYIKSFMGGIGLLKRENLFW
jgi:hypothetical protein